MITIKKKKCTGTGKAKGYGCNEIKFPFRYGLCQKCYSEFMWTSDYGKDIIKKTIPKAKQQVSRAKKAEKKKIKNELKTPSELKKELQNIINFIVRYIDEGKGCISCDHGHSESFTRQKHAGHYYSVGANPALRFNLNNNFLQCSICNNYLSGNLIEYTKRLPLIHGQEALEKVIKLKREVKELKLTKVELREAIFRAKKIRKELTEGKEYTREEINEMLNIYN